jgi:hypothetical protein
MTEDETFRVLKRPLFSKVLEMICDEEYLPTGTFQEVVSSLGWTMEEYSLELHKSKRNYE